MDTATAEVTAITRTTSTSGDPSIDRTTTFTRDAWGNVLTATSTSAEPTRTVRLTYEPTGYFVDSITNALGHRTAVEIEARFGQIHRAEDPNGVEALRSFDGFGRLREARSTGRGGVEISYDLADPVGRHQVRIDPDEGGHEVVEYDRLGRAVASQVEHAFVTSYAFREFDRLGRLVAESAPFTDPAEASTVARHRYIYDLIGRVTSTTSADGVVTGYEYGVAERRVTPVAADGTNTTTTTELDRAGRVLAVEEPETTEIAEGDTRVATAPAARTSYQYCRSGALRRTRDPRGHVTTVEYDDLGRRVFLEDPAAGVARFEHNALDEIARTEDALGRVNRWERDVLGRIEALHHEADGIVDRFFYDTAPLGTTGRTVLGALASSESGDGVIDTYEYDSVARTRAQSRLVEGRLLRFENDLDDFGRVLETRYPDTLGLGAIAVSNRYDARSGETTEVWLDGDRVWRLEAQNGFGAATGEHLGSPGGGSPAWGEIDRASVYSADGRMTRLESRAGAIQLQDFQYDYEDRGLLTRRVDGLLGRSDELVYDELRHLRTLGERGAAVRERYSMDEIGNLTATHDGELHYLDPAHPYAATEIDGPNGGSFRYDAVGNAYRARDLEIAYTQRNLPRTIDSDKTGLVRYTYDAGGGRASKRGRDTDITYFGLYELERRGMQLYERLSIDTPVGVVAQVERGAQSGPNGPGSRLRWLLVERQGSVETTWVSGESPQHIQYDAYGGVLTSGGSASGERPGATVSQGYTSHEHEDDVELINMGGRVYSPHLRRFLTADPLVMDPVGQGLNAYLYASGSPSNATDPTGLYVLWSEQVEFDGGPALLLWDQHGNVAACGVDGRGCVSDGEFDWGDGPATERAGAGASGSATATTSGSVEPPWLEQLDTNPAVLGWMNFAAGFGESVTDLLPPVTHMADQRTGVVDVAVRSVLAPVRSYNRGAGLHNGVIDPTSPRYRDGADVAMLWWLSLGGAAMLSPARAAPLVQSGAAFAEAEGGLHSGLALPADTRAIPAPTVPGPTLDRATGYEVGRFVVDGRGNAMIEPVGGSTVPYGPTGVDTHTRYPNGSNYQRLNPAGHPGGPHPYTRHGHGHLPGTGPGKKGQGASIDPLGNPVSTNSAEAHWTIL